MNSQYYTQIYLPNDENFPGENIDGILKEVLSECRPQRIALNEWEGSPDSQVDVWTAFWGGWALHLCFSDQSHVAEEAAEIAQHHKLQPPFDRLVSCQRRIELWTEVDVNMDYFNDYIFVLEATEKRFPNAILLDAEANPIYSSTRFSPNHGTR